MIITLCLIALTVFFSLDMVWLGVVAKPFYSKQLGYLMAPRVRWGVALTFYLIFIVGLVVFVIAPAVRTHSLVDALLYGAFFGFVTYATYDLTNLATINKWPVLVTAVDLVWGTVLALSVSGITYSIASALAL